MPKLSQTIYNAKIVCRKINQNENENVAQVHDGRRVGYGRAVHVLQVQASRQTVLCHKVASHMDKVSFRKISR